MTLRIVWPDNDISGKRTSERIFLSQNLNSIYKSMRFKDHREGEKMEKYFFFHLSIEE